MRPALSEVRARRGSAETILLDVTRLIWRAWKGRLPTGIDRVCLAYLQHYGERSQAIIQRRGLHLLISPSQSRRLYSLLSSSGPVSRWRLAGHLALGIGLGLARSGRAGQFYLNVGHTGLDEPSLPRWIRRRRLRAIYLVHDLIPLTHPQFCRPGEAGRHKRRMTNALISGAGIIGNSRTTLNELRRFADRHKISMPQSVAAWISGAEGVVHGRGAPSLPGPYFVTLGTIEGRKNHAMLLGVWQALTAMMGEQAPTLVIIGQRGWEADDVLRLLDRPSQFAGKIIELNHCSDEQAAAWMAHARALLMPSHVEGFGLPLIEALDLGTPIIASNLPVFEEIAGPIPLFLDPDDAEAWQGAVIRFIADDPQRQRQLALMEDYSLPSWNDHFAIVDRWLAELPAEPTKLHQPDNLWV